MTETEVNQFLLDNDITYRGKPATTAQWSISAGWYGLVCDALFKLRALGWDKELFQVKEKFGGLRIYTENHPGDQYEAFNSIIQQAETLSFYTCEICGGQGKVDEDNAWLRCRCEEHKSD